MASSRKIELWPVGSPDHSKLPISVKLLQKLRREDLTLKAATSVEERWDLVVENYAELETEWLRLSLNSALLFGRDITSFFAINRLLARRMGNLLSSARSYVDYLKKKVKRAFPATAGSILEMIAKLNEDEADFRLMEELRNFLQHNEMPLGTSHGWRREDSKGTTKFLFSTRTNLIPKTMLQDTRISKRVQKDLLSTRKEVPINDSVRHYMELLWGVHAQYRQAAVPRTAQSIRLYDDIIARLIKLFPKMAQFDQKLFLVLFDGVATYSEKESVEFFDTTIQNYKALLRKNVALTNLRKRIVTGEV